MLGVSKQRWRWLVTATPALLTAAGFGFGDPPVQVVVDMDAACPGFQSSVVVSACTEVVRGVAIYVYDPLEQRSVWSIGYLGGLDRGIAFGHSPSNTHQGTVVSVTGTPVAPVNPGNAGWLVPSDYMDPAFAGPELQYTEFGAAAPATIGGLGNAPVAVFDITLQGAQPGDRFDFHLADFVTIWSGGTGGAFTTAEAYPALDSGGDVVPDGTVTLYGVDVDGPIPVPPGAFAVDYRDGPEGGGPAVIEIIAAPADVDGDGQVDTTDLVTVLQQWGPCPPACSADVNDDGQVDIADLLAVILAWGC